MTDLRTEQALAYINKAEREKRQKKAKRQQSNREECILLTRKLQYMLDNPGHYKSTLNSVPPRKWFRVSDVYSIRCAELKEIIDEVNNNGGPIKVSLEAPLSFVTDVKTTTNGSTVKYHLITKI